MDRYLQDNQANWDERAAVHAASEDYDLDRYVREPDHVSPVVAFDLDALGGLAGLRVLHLQCHIGTDTLSLARAGAAAVVGFDFSSASLDVARDLARRCGDDRVRFVQGDVHDAPAVLAGERFDVVYTTVGVLCWLPDIAAWARVVRAVLRPGGRLLLRDDHPIRWALDVERTDELVLRYPYFEQPDPLTWDDGTTYTDGGGAGAISAATEHEWNHGIGEILTAVLDVGLRIDRFEEFDDMDWAPNPTFVRNDRGRLRLPEPLHRRLPLEFRLVATAPGPEAPGGLG